MSLSPKLERAVSTMGFDFATPIQSEAIPVIRTGVDVIARSQTGTGKTIAFGIPAIEIIDADETKSTIQVLILCPTRELALQADEEIRKLARFKEGIRPVAVYGGAPIDKQCIALRRANIVIGTPGRVMDHMRRKTIKLDCLKMIVLDEADEMLNMGFKEDIETILTDTPEDRQTILFSATMPPAIMKITSQFQKNPTLIEIDKSQVTIENIEQRYIDVPHSSKKEALAIILKYCQPTRAIIFCGTKRMADELTEFLNARKINAESIHSDIKQAQRTATMQDFKAGKTTILIATDIAARGIDVNDVEYVINFDIPPNTDYYIHRIGRTGRAGKDGCSITICSSRREVNEIRQIAIAVKSVIKEMALPTAADIQAKLANKAKEEIEAHITAEVNARITDIINELIEKGHSLQSIAEAALSLHCKDLLQTGEMAVNQIRHEEWGHAAMEVRRPAAERKASQPKPIAKFRTMDYALLALDIGSSNRVTANHIIGAITDRTGISGREIGKVDIAAEQSLVEVPADRAEELIEEMKGCKICGRPTRTFLLAGAPQKSGRPSGAAGRAQSKTGAFGRPSAEVKKRRVQSAD